MCGVELTLQRVERFISAGALAYDNKERKLPETKEMDFDDRDGLILSEDLTW